MRAQKQLGIVEAVEIIDRIARAEFDSLDFLQINVVNLLRHRRRAAVFQTREGFLQGIVKLSVEHGRQRRIIYRIISRLRCVIDDPAAVRQDHKLIIVNVNHRAVGNGVRRSPAVAAAAHHHALGKYGAFPHLTRLNDLQELIVHR